MYHSNGNYEAFARPKKPEGVDDKSAYLVGSGLASLSAAAFLIRDGQMKGENIHILEELPLPGGSLDGSFRPDHGFVMRGGREMENHFECLWDLFRTIPSAEDPNVSVLDEFYWINKEDPNYSKCRLIENRGQRKPDDGKFTLTDQDRKEMIKLYITAEDQLNNVRIDEVFSPEFFKSNFWYYWSTMFAFETWHSAMEMRRYIMRFIHHIDGLPDFSALKFTKYNQYESLVKPLVNWLKDQGVHFQYDTKVKNVLIDTTAGKTIAHTLVIEEAGIGKNLELTENELVFVTNGSITESSTYGTNDTPAPTTKAPGGSWALWDNIAKQGSDFGNPKKFYENIPDAAWFVSATVTTLDKKVAPYIERLCKRDPYSGKTVTGGIITAVDSNWMLSFTVNRQPQFRDQPKDKLCIWVYALFSDRPGDFIKKPITECSGSEIAQEWMYQMGVPEDEIKDLAENSCNTVPVYMPYITSYFQPREKGDRPLVIPNGSQNLAFIGNFSETERDTVFTTEYSVRTAMEAVYTLLDIDRGVPEVFASAYDIREMLNASSYLMDGAKITEMKEPFIVKKLEEHALEKAKGTWIHELLQEYKLI